MISDSNSDSHREREIFLAALEVADPAERAAYVAAACQGDETLKRRILELLAEEKAVGNFLERPACDRSATPSTGSHGTDAAPAPEECGDRIGRYKLLQKIGEGGCGVVYMAEQEEHVRRRVALKIIKLGMDTRQVIARFEAERQALAMMDHPNIAKVLDAGATATGRPYFVMELVRGIKITEYCDQNNLRTADRLELFIEVCHAIQHAHQKGIIHRDIKPSNVLVTSHDGTPVPKVIDFGVAKATNQQRLTDKTVFTAFEQFIGTPAYMSPEQAEMSGLDIDTRSDVYSLGVLLYELLIGKTPFDAETLIKNGLDECRRTIRMDEPARPSARLTRLLDAELTTAAARRNIRGPELIHMLRGDLDWVVMKCLEKDRTRRYETVNGLATDVQHYLDGEPVLARPPSTLYRFQKFARRNRPALAASTAIALTLLSGAGLSIWLAIRATHAEHEASASHKQEALLRRQAENGWERARETAARARLNEYVADINLVHQSLLSGNFGRAVQLLEKHKPQPGQADLRGVEWRYLWQASRGDSHTALPTQEGPVQALAYSPNGELLLTSVRDHFKVWNIRSGTAIAKISAPVSSFLFTPAGDALYTSGQGGIRKWNTSDWSEQKSTREGAGGLALSPDGRVLAIGARQEIRLVDTATWALLKSYPGCSSPISFSPDGKLLASDSANGITLWPLDGSNPGTVLDDSTNIFPKGGPGFRGNRSAAFSPDGKVFVAARNTRSAHGLFVLSLWDVETGSSIGSMPDSRDRVEHTGGIAGLAFSPDGKRLATASMDHSIRVWDVSARRRLATLQGNLTEVWTVAFSPDGQAIASGAKDGAIKLWHSNVVEKAEMLSGDWHPLFFSRDGRTLVALDSPDTLAFVNVSTLEQEQQFQFEPGRRHPWSISVSQDLKTIAEALSDGRIRLWNTQTRETIFLKTGEMSVGLVSLSANGRHLITGGFGQPARWWDLASATNHSLEIEVHRALFSPDERTLALFTRNGGIQIWDLPTHSLRKTLATDPMPGFAAAFSPDGRLFATTSGPADVEPEIQLWNAHNGRQVGTCVGHKQTVMAVAFSADGRTLASTSDDSTLRFWNVTTCQELLSSQQSDLQNRILFSPDGRLLVTSNGRPMQPGPLQFHRLPLLPEIDSTTAQKGFSAP